MRFRMPDLQENMHRVEEELRQVLNDSVAAGRALTLASLTQPITADKMARAGRALTEYADEAIEIIRDVHRPPLACGQGCSFCCHRPGVLVTVPEFIHLWRRVSDFGESTLARVRVAAAAYASLASGLALDQANSHNIPCPLLDDGRCSVYAARPLCCRGYNSLDVDCCRRGFESAAGLPVTGNDHVPAFSLLMYAANGTQLGAGRSLGQAWGRECPDRSRICLAYRLLFGARHRGSTDRRRFSGTRTGNHPKAGAREMTGDGAVCKTEQKSRKRTCKFRQV